MTLNTTTLALLISTALSPLAQGATVTRTTHYTYNSFGELETRTDAPGDTRLQVLTRHSYDTAGRLLSSTVTGQGEDGKPMAVRTNSQTYSSDGRFIASRTNAIGQQENYTFHPVFGQPTSVTTIDGTVTRWEYDGAGRKVLETRPDGSRTRWVYSQCNNTCTTQNSGKLFAVWSLRETLTDAAEKLIGPTTTHYYSAADLLLVSETLGFDGRISTIRYEYDINNRLWRQSKPYFPGETPKYTVLEYDIKDRIIKQTEPDGAVTLTTYSAADKLALVSIKNALGQITTRKYDSQGNLIEIRDANNRELRYAYTPTGELAQTIDTKGNTTTIEYDLYGRKTKLIDPNLGTWLYTYNSLGELRSQKDANQNSSQLDYDALGRLVKRTEADLISQWEYDTATNGKGKLAKATTSTGYARTHQYDSLGRPTVTTVTLGSDGSYSKTIAYDAAGRLSQLSYPAGLKVNYHYNSNGYLQSLSNATTGKTYWQAQNMDAAGRATRIAFAGGAAAVNRVYNNRDRIELVDAGGVFKESYVYDSIGNLKTRNLKITAGTPYQYNENFSYDTLNRLTRASGDNPVSTQDIVYDELGNITYKSGVGNYTYPASAAGVIRPHALTSLTKPDGSIHTYRYDNNGNLLQSGDRTATWTSYNLPKTLGGYGQSEEYWYDSEHERIKQVSSQSGTQLYFNPGKGSGLFYEKQTGKDGKVEHKQYLSANGEVIGEVVKRDNPAAGQAAEEERYWVKDHLGSNRAVLGSSGQLLESLGFDAWGKRRLASGQTDAANPGIAGVTTDRGYTGHEQLDELGLVHMNARIYDPQLGRFLSPDPEVTDTERMQNFNRYSYVLNNPLAYTDPSGEAWWNDWGDFKAAIGFGDKVASSSNKTAPPEKFKQSMDNLAKLVADSRTPDAARVKADQLVKGGLAVKSIAGAEDYERELIDGFREIIRACGRSCADYSRTIDLDARIRLTAHALRFNEVAAMGMQDAFAGGGAVVASLKAASQTFKKAVGLMGGSVDVAKGTAFRDFNQARNAAVEWLGARGFKAEQATLGRLGDNAGKPIGMKTADGSVGFRVEYDARSGAHINTWAGKEKGPHFTFEGNQSMVDQIVKQFVK